MASRDYYAINFKAEQRRAIKVANELFYGKDVVKRLKEAKTVSELSMILRTAREELIK